MISFSVFRVSLLNIDIRALNVDVSGNCFGTTKHLRHDLSTHTVICVLSVDGVIEGQTITETIRVKYG